ncbi:MAG: hypothetical protein HY898_29775 [Deltaproteobacteria bacterium]|nr:hypothetical protein [Deltaproteobacteria bacterium]
MVSPANRALRCFALALGLAIASIAPAQAADPPDQTPARVKAAAEEFDAGRRAFTAKDYSTAADHFENAEHDVPSPEAIRLAIRARKMAKEDARMATLAAAAMHRYSDNKETVALAKQMIGQVRSKLHKIDVTCDPACNLIVDSRVTPWGESTTATVFVEPGEHTVSAGWSADRTESNTVSAKAAGASELAFHAPPLPPKKEDQPPPPKKPPPPPPKPGLPPAVFYIAAGATVLAGGVTIWSTADMISTPGRDQVRADCAGKDESCPTYQDALSRQRRTNILIGVTGGLAVTTAVVGLFFTKWGSQPAEAPKEARGVVPVVSMGDGLTLGAAGKF